MHFAELAATSATVAATRSRSGKIRILAEAIAGLEPDELDLVVRFLAGQTRQERLEVGWAALSGDPPSPSPAPTLSIADVDDAFAGLAAATGPGSRDVRRGVLADLFARATADEQTYLRALILGEVRQGALEGVVVAGIAAAAGVPVGAVQRGLMLSGDLGRTAVLALHGGKEALAALALELFRPVHPMLAATSGSVSEAFADLGRMFVDYKLDGARIQVHRRGGEVRVYTRNLRQVHRPEVVAAVGGFAVTDVVLDGEVVAVGPDGRPRPFQETMSGFGTEVAPGPGVPPAEVVLRPYFFDCLRHDGHDLLDEPLSIRAEVLRAVVPDHHRVPRLLADDDAAAADFFDAALAEGHEGVVCKAPDAPYAAGRRGSAWRKVKPVHTLDLVVLAAEWGSGRRRGWLSNLHLGARDPDGRYGRDGFVMLGKTFKGLTDEMLTWQTQRLLGLEVGRRGHVVDVRPELVVEIAFDGVQGSSRYPGGVALRFARVKGYREDKRPGEADTIDTVRRFRV